MHVATLLNVPPIVYFLDELKGRIRKAHHSFKDEHKEKRIQLSIEFLPRPIPW